MTATVSNMLSRQPFTFSFSAIIENATLVVQLVTTPPSSENLRLVGNMLDIEILASQQLFFKLEDGNIFGGLDD